jgi:uncharacterized membrane protein
MMFDPFWHFFPSGLFMFSVFGLPLALLLVGVAVWLLSRSPSTAQSLPPASDPALVVLRERFARGEIDEDEHHQRKRILEQR